MKTIELKDGFTVQVDEAVADDAELLDSMVEADEGNPIAVSKLCTKLLAPAEKKKLYNHLRDETTKRVPVAKVVLAVVEIIQGLGRTEEDGKNS